MKICGFGKTDKGLIRENNEDNIYIDGQFVQDTTVSNACYYVNEKKNCHTCAVCDGVGGADCGEFASLAAVRGLQCFDFCNLVNITDCIFELNRLVLSEARKRHIKDMGSTIALAHIKEGILHYANVGDSKIYCYTSGQLEQLSVDHTRNQMMKNAGINNEDLFKRYDHQLTQSLGISEEDFIIEPSIGSKEIKVGDIVILCSDGLTDVISNVEINEILLNSSNFDAETIVNNLFDTAIEKNTRDNISIIVLKVEQ